MISHQTLFWLTQQPQEVLLKEINNLLSKPSAPVFILRHYEESIDDDPVIAESFDSAIKILESWFPKRCITNQTEERKDEWQITLTWQEESGEQGESDSYWITKVYPRR